MVNINWTNVTTARGFLQAPNVSSGGSFWAVTLYMFWIVLLVVFLPFGFEVALLFSAFLALVASIFMLYGGLISVGNMLFFVGLIIFWILYIIWSSNKDQ